MLARADADSLELGKSAQRSGQLRELIVVRIPEAALVGRQHDPSER
jgi:hypothetical protein